MLTDSVADGTIVGSTVLATGYLLAVDGGGEVLFRIVCSHEDIGLIYATLQDVGAGRTREKGNLVERVVALAYLFVKHIDSVELGIHCLRLHADESDQCGTGNSLIEVEHLPGDKFFVFVEGFLVDIEAEFHVNRVFSKNVFDRLFIFEYTLLQEICIRPFQGIFAFGFAAEEERGDIVGVVESFFHPAESPEVDSSFNAVEVDGAVFVFEFYGADYLGIVGIDIDFGLGCEFADEGVFYTIDGGTKFLRHGTDLLGLFPFLAHFVGTVVIGQLEVGIGVFQFDL